MVEAEVSAALAAGGFLAAEDEAAQLVAAAAGDARRLDELVARRLTGEPLAWITGTVRFCGVAMGVDPGVYVPRPYTEVLALHAVGRLPERGTAIDLCTGAGAIAATLRHRRPHAQVLATDIDERAVTCARRNGVHALRGDLLRPVPRGLAGSVDVVVAVVPYVPTAELPYLQRDTFTFESPLGYDGGADGARLLRRVIRGSKRFLRDGGTLLLELGGDQQTLIAPDLVRAGLTVDAVLRDEDGDVRGVEAVLRTPGARTRR
ncbi:MAG: methyltransferase [Candidatus Dormibacteria bacterium]